MNIYNCKILSSFESEEKGELKSIKAKFFLIYEAKSKKNYRELIEQIQYRTNFIKDL